MSESFLAYGRHQIDDDDIAAVVDVLKNGALTCGPKVDAFEAAFAAKVGAREAVVCSNGTTALHLAMMGLDIGPGDVVIVPTVTFLSTANGARMAGADVVFADVCPDTGLLTADTLEEAFGRAGQPVKAVLPVHLNGQCVDIESIERVSRAHGAAVVTDCCHALGATYKGALVGAPGDGQFEDMACFSLHPVKSIAMGEGGVVTMSDPDLAGRLRILRSQGMVRDPASWQQVESGFSEGSGAPNPWYYEMQELGYNYRATDLQCALGLSQLAKLDGFVARRRELAELYDRQFEAQLNSLVPVSRTHTAESAWHLYPVLIDFRSQGRDRAAVMADLAELGVGTQVHYIPVSSQPYYEKLYGKQRFSGAERYYERVLSLPIFPAMSDDDVERVVTCLGKVLR
ncbi:MULTISPECIES: UDP-4-amino-4,6-dideoxy-N-acetyl-beta-L-altrosamine transaminase [Kordiimonas]|jgi:UDP-4-amino-4,6-dideoxy-N-acetyl-beta-L-altrosamine transaminase|uniref:UDP-4-amino-4, 6-dideoxy-N-acetyl-beta-L-altrosamine transaminase n=1 Tax=Kordiimonas TaxID=288021 RepID=UPI00257BFCAC|nr:UDP-4-amino-4,6-dideoxy-N-acetyl-beta-L-altrosamine transaminase [Kordiimonas sp. UBA4487]